MVSGLRGPFIPGGLGPSPNPLGQVVSLPATGAAILCREVQH